MMPHLQDGYPHPYPCPFFCWNAEARENLSLDLDKEQCGLWGHSCWKEAGREPVRYGSKRLESTEKLWKFFRA